MIIPILTSALILSLAVSVWLGIFTLIRCESKKKTSFVAMQAAVFMFLLGYLLEINADSIDGGMIAVRIRYIGVGIRPGGLPYVYRRLLRDKARQACLWPFAVFPALGHNARVDDANFS